MTPRFVLASSSPARRRLLRDAGLRFDVIPSNVDESRVSAPEPAHLARLLAAAKARDVAGRLISESRRNAAAEPGPEPEEPEQSEQPEQPDRTLVLGCDSILEIDGQGFGKPSSPTEARKDWARMTGRHGVLHTGHCLVELVDGEVERETVAVAATTIHFGRPDAEEVAAYVASGEPLRVAGGFTIDGLSAWFVERIEGDHSTVIGLSLPLLRYMLRDHGLRITDLWR